MNLGDTMMGCRICDVDKCNECCEKARRSEHALSTPPAIPSVPNSLASHRNSRLEIKPPSRDTSREPSPVREFGGKGLPKTLPGSSEGLPTTIKRPPTLPKATPPRIPGKKPKAPPARPKAPPILPQAPPNLPKAPPMEMVRTIRSISPPAVPDMIRHIPSTSEKRGALGTIGDATESVYTLPDDPNTAPPDAPIPPRSFQHAHALE